MARNNLWIETAFSFFKALLLNTKIKRIIYHILFWLLFISIPFIFLPIAEISPKFRYFDLSSALHLSLFIVLFYFNYCFLYPKYFHKQRFISYILIGILSCVAVAFLNAMIAGLNESSRLTFSENLVTRPFRGFITIAAGTVFHMLRDSYKAQKEFQKRELETIKTELSFLRSQVNPHFLFNVLNTLLSLIRQKSDLAEATLINLSNLMRYMLYETIEEKASLQSELSFIKTYIDLQMLRFGDKLKLTLTFDNEMPDALIEPMILIPLVENAFKHGATVLDNPEISISIRRNNLNFIMVVKNKYSSHFLNSTDKNNGIGLSNLEKRLMLLYPGKYHLDVNRNSEWFVVSLGLEIYEMYSN